MSDVNCAEIEKIYMKRYFNVLLIQKSVRMLKVSDKRRFTVHTNTNTLICSHGFNGDLSKCTLLSALVPYKGYILYY